MYLQLHCLAAEDLVVTNSADEFTSTLPRQDFTGILVGNPTPVRGILEKILPEVLQNLPKAVGRGQILEGRGQDFFQQFRGMRGWISA